MKKYLSFLAIAGLVAAFCVFSFAEAKVNENVRDTRTAVKKDVKSAKKEIKKVVRDAKVEGKQQLRDDAKKGKEELKELKENAKVLTGDMRETFQKQIEEKRATLETKLKIEREDLKKKLKTVRDLKKRETVEKISDDVNVLNTRMVGVFTENLTKLSTVISRIGKKADSLALKGVDVAPVKSAIATAEVAISDARTAVTTQAGKTYTVTFTKEATLKVDVGGTRKMLRDDAQKTQDMIKKAREAVRSTALVYVGLPREVREALERENESSTSTPTSTASTSPSSQETSQ